MAEHAYVKSWIPEIESLQISPDGTTILDSDGHPIGKDPGRAFEGLLSGGRHPGVTGIGETTLLRALITRMAKDGASVDFRQSSMAVLGDDRSPVLGEDSGRTPDANSVHRGGKTGNAVRKDLAKGALYSPAADVAPEAAAAALQRKLATAGLTAQEHPQLTLVISGKINHNPPMETPKQSIKNSSTPRLPEPGERREIVSKQPLRTSEQMQKEARERMSRKRPS